MPRRRGTVGSFPESFIDPQIHWNDLRNTAEAFLPRYIPLDDDNITHADPVGFERRNLNEWRIEEPGSSSTPQNVKHDEPTNILSLDNVNANTLFVQRADSATDPQSINLNVAIGGHDGNNCQVTESHDLHKSSGPENELILPANGSDPFLLHPARGGFLAEENDGTGGSSLEGQHASCKRKAVEGNASSSSSTSVPSEELNRPDWSWSTIENAESSRRNFRLRVNPSNDDSVTNSYSTANTARLPSRSSTQQSSRFPVNLSLDFTSATVMDDTNSQNQSAAGHFQALPQHEQLFRWNESSSLRTAGSSNSSIPGDRDIASHEEAWPRSMPRSILEHPMFIPAPQFGSLIHNPTDSSLTGGNRNTSVTGDAASRYPRRLSEYVRRSLSSSDDLEPAGQSGSHSSLQSGLPASSHDMALPSGAGNLGHHHHHHLYARLASRAERQGDGALAFPHSFHTLPAGSEGRRRLASEIRNVLDLMRRGEGLRFEDVMILNQSGIFGVGDAHDRHRDMRLDVDNMSYEELLALEERIGNVCTGLKEETISSRLKQRKHYSTAGARAEAEPCCVCQEEYNDGEDLGALDCGHEFHAECIKQWLMKKNSCPVCKTTGLST